MPVTEAEERALREKCVNHARNTSADQSDEGIIASAQRYYDFITGKKPYEAKE